MTKGTMPMKSLWRAPLLSTLALSVLLTVGSPLARAGDDDGHDHGSSNDRGHRDERLRENIKNIVVIYAENRSFDNLFGHFPGAHGLDDVLHKDGTPRRAFVPQVDRDGSPDR